MKLYDLLCCMEYFQHINIYRTNEYGQCLFVFRGTVQEARKDVEDTFWHLEDEVSVIRIMKNGNNDNTLLIYIDYEGLAENLYSESQVKRWIETGKHPWKYEIDVEKEVESKV